MHGVERGAGIHDRNLQRPAPRVFYWTGNIECRQCAVRTFRYGIRSGAPGALAVDRGSDTRGVLELGFTDLPIDEEPYHGR